MKLGFRDTLNQEQFLSRLPESTHRLIKDIIYESQGIKQNLIGYGIEHLKKMVYPSKVFCIEKEKVIKGNRETLEKVKDFNVIAQKLNFHANTLL